MRPGTGSSSDTLMKSIDELASTPPGTKESDKVEKKIRKLQQEEAAAAASGASPMS